MFWKVVFILFVGFFGEWVSSHKCPQIWNCPRNSVYMLGNNCTDSCFKETMRCTSDMWYSCFCVDGFRRGQGRGPYCIKAEKCRRV